jgi:hypothetical protein
MEFTEAAGVVEAAGGGPSALPVHAVKAPIRVAALRAAALRVIAAARMRAGAPWEPNRVEDAMWAS